MPVAAPMSGLVARLLQHPLTAGMSVDDPRTTELRRQIIQEKPFLRSLYLEWYRTVQSRLPAGAAPMLEIGAGAGFMKEVIGDVIASEIFACPWTDIVMDACRMPWQSGSLRAILMTDVLHHIPYPEAFLREASRVLQPGGRIVMIEPWHTGWSRFVYTRFHPEPFRPESVEWGFPVSGPLSGANGAMPWMIFERDRERFATLFPEFSLVEKSPMMPFSYLLSGGVSMRALCPGFLYPVVRAVERLVQPLESSTAMFALVVVEKRR